MYPELMSKSIADSPLMGLLKIDQLAFLARTDEDELAIKRTLRLESANWVEDEVFARGYVQGINLVGQRDAGNLAKLQFNYDLGIEVEILRYLEGPNYPDVGMVKSRQLCHIGFHVDRGKVIPPELHRWTFAFPIIQEVWTEEHTNKFLIDTGRRYHYTIYDTKPLLGVYLKVIERMEANDVA